MMNWMAAALVTMRECRGCVRWVLSALFIVLIVSALP